MMFDIRFQNHFTSMLIAAAFSLNFLMLNIECSAQDVSISSGDEQPTISEDDPLGLKLVRDDRWLTANENPAYYGLLNQANEIPQQELAASAKEFIQKRRTEAKLSTFVDMIRNTKEFRGQPVVMKGHILQTLEYEAEENSFGIEHLYESTLYTEDSQSHPTTIIFLEKPDNLPLGGETVNGVTVYGYFLKTYLYPSSDKATRKAPLILAKTLTVQPSKVAKLPTETNPMIYWGIGSGLAVLIFVIILVQRSDRRRMLENQKKRLDEQQPVFGE